MTLIALETMDEAPPYEPGQLLTIKNGQAVLAAEVDLDGNIGFERVVFGEKTIVTFIGLQYNKEDNIDMVFMYKAKTYCALSTLKDRNIHFDWFSAAEFLPKKKHTCPTKNIALHDTFACFVI
jgi:hypothetical protein